MQVGDDSFGEMYLKNFSKHGINIGVFIDKTFIYLHFVFTVIPLLFFNSYYYYLKSSWPSEIQ